MQNLSVSDAPSMVLRELADSILHAIQSQDDDSHILHKALNIAYLTELTKSYVLETFENRKDWFRHFFKPALIAMSRWSKALDVVKKSQSLFDGDHPYALTHVVRSCLLATDYAKAPSLYHLNHLHWESYFEKWVEMKDERGEAVATATRWVEEMKKDIAMYKVEWERFWGKSYSTAISSFLQAYSSARLRCGRLLLKSMDILTDELLDLVEQNVDPNTVDMRQALEGVFKCVRRQYCLCGWADGSIERLDDLYRDLYKLPTIYEWDVELWREEYTRRKAEDHQNESGQDTMPESRTGVASSDDSDNTVAAESDEETVEPY